MEETDKPTDANETCVGPQHEMAGKAESCQGCPNAKLCASAPKGPNPDLEVIKERLKDVKRKVMVLSGKGGVGKSTVTKELAFSLGRADLSVGLLDADICGPSLPRITGAYHEDVHSSNSGLEPVSVDDNVVLMSMHYLLSARNDAVVWRGPKKNGMISTFLKDVTWGELDVLLCDTPPGTTDEHISTVTLLRDSAGIDGAVIVTTPQEVAIADVRREITFCQKTKVPIIGIVENMSGFVCPKCTKPSEIFPCKAGEKLTAGERLANEVGVPFLGRVPIDPALMRSCEDGIPLYEALQQQHATAAQAGQQTSPTLASLDAIVAAIRAQLQL